MASSFSSALALPPTSRKQSAADIFDDHMNTVQDGGSANNLHILQLFLAIKTSKLMRMHEDDLELVLTLAMLGAESAAGLTFATDPVPP